MKFHVSKIHGGYNFHEIHGKWYIGVSPSGYLHSDLTVHWATSNPNGQYLGYYKTREKARQAVRQYRQQEKFVFLEY